MLKCLASNQALSSSFSLFFFFFGGGGGGGREGVGGSGGRRAQWGTVAGELQVPSVETDLAQS